MCISMRITSSEINITPIEVTLGDSVEISIIVSNMGDVTGIYKVTLNIDDAVMTSQEVTLDGGEDRLVSFSITPETIGEHTVAIGDQLAVFNVMAVTAPIAEAKSGTGPEISHFSVTPIYDTETGELTLTRIDYQIDRVDQLSPGAQLILKVFLEGEPWEEIPLLTLDQLQSDVDVGSLGYIPSQEWGTGAYTFQVELRDSDGSVRSTHQQRFTLIPESLTKAVSWGSLGLIIGLTLIVVLTVVAVVLYRRREMLKGYVE